MLLCPAYSSCFLLATLQPTSTPPSYVVSDLIIVVSVFVDTYSVMYLGGVGVFAVSSLPQPSKEGHEKEGEPQVVHPWRTTLVSQKPLCRRSIETQRVCYYFGQVLVTLRQK